MVPLAGLIDVGAERARLGKEIDRLVKELGRVRGKLANEQFTAKAPDAVVAKEREKEAEAAAALEALQAQLETLPDA
jgi:valyl-tRNA synthetase